MLGAGNQCWAFATMVDPAAGRSAMPLACGDGLYHIQNVRAIPIKKTKDLSFRPNSLVVSGADPTGLWVGLFDGLASFRWAHGRWIDEGRIEGVNDEVRFVFEGILMARCGPGLPAPGSSTCSSRPSPEAAAAARHPGSSASEPKRGFQPVASPSRTSRACPCSRAASRYLQALHYDATTRRFDCDTAFDHVVGVK